MYRTLLHTMTRTIKLHNFVGLKILKIWTLVPNIVIMFYNIQDTTGLYEAMEKAISKSEVSLCHLTLLSPETNYRTSSASSFL